MPAKTDTSRNAVIGLAEMVENKARQFAPGMPGRDFYMDVADTLRALVDERVYPSPDMEERGDHAAALVDEALEMCGNSPLAALGAMMVAAAQLVETCPDETVPVVLEMMRETVEAMERAGPQGRCGHA